MKVWRLGDEVGTGELYLPTDEIRHAYGLACRAAQVESAAIHAIGLVTLEERRAYIETHEPFFREALKGRIKILWETKA